MHSLVEEAFRVALTVTLVRLDTDAELVCIGVLLLNEGPIGPELLHGLVGQAVPQKTSLLVAASPAGPCLEGRSARTRTSARSEASFTMSQATLQCPL